LYGSADDEIPFLQHGDAHPPLEHTKFTAALTSGGAGRERGLPAAVHTPHGGGLVSTSGDGGAGACCCSGGGGGARARGGACGVSKELPARVGGHTYSGRRR